MNTEPARIVALINAAIAATIGVLIVADVVEDVLGGALVAALAAWVVVAGEFVRARVTPVAVDPPDDAGQSAINLLVTVLVVVVLVLLCLYLANRI